MMRVYPGKSFKMDKEIIKRLSGTGVHIGSLTDRRMIAQQIFTLLFLQKEYCP